MLSRTPSLSPAYSTAFHGTVVLGRKRLCQMYRTRRSLSVPGQCPFVLLQLLHEVVVSSGNCQTWPMTSARLRWEESLPLCCCIHSYDGWWDTAPLLSPRRLWRQSTEVWRKKIRLLQGHGPRSQDPLPSARVHEQAWAFRSAGKVILCWNTFKLFPSTQWPWPWNFS